jgi:UDP-glucose 4-epimerase
LRILVTGGAGFIGSHVAEAFHNAGHQMLALDDLSRGSRDNLASAVSLEVADIRDGQAVDRIFSGFKPEVVSHHAAQISVRDSVDDPVFDAEVNILGSLRLLEASVKHGVNHFMFASTGGAIYGEQEVFPAQEDHPARPLSPYGVAKLAVERYLYFYAHTHHLSWTALRYSNVYGPRQDPFGEAGVVAIFCKRMLSGERPVINGDGEQTRDYVYVGDVAVANLSALERSAKGPVNISTGVETSVNDIFRLIREFTGADADEAHGPAKPGEQRRSVLDPGLAKKIMGWEPRVALREGIEKTVAFFKEHQAHA